jgi:hypothetical protein
MDDKRRNEITLLRQELLRRIAGGSSEKPDTLERVTAIIEQYAAMLPQAQTRFDRIEIAKRKSVKDMIDFYQSIITILTRDKGNYLI